MAEITTAAADRGSMLERNLRAVARSAARPARQPHMLIGSRS